MRTNAMNRSNGRALLRGAALSLGVLTLPPLALAQEAPAPGVEAQPNTTGPGSLDGPRTPVSEGQAESTADMLGTDRLLERDPSDVPVTEGQAESQADALGGVDDEGTVPFGPQPAGTGTQDDLGFGEQGVLDLGQQPRAGGADVGVEGQDLPDTDLGARGVDVDGARVEPIFPDVNRAARGVESTEPGGIEQPLEDADLAARGVRLQGEQVNEELDDVRAESSRGVELSEGARAAPGEIPARNVPGGGVIVVPGTGVVVVEGGGVAGGGVAGGGVVGGGAGAAGAQPLGGGIPAAGEGVEPVGEGVAPVESGVIAAASTELTAAEPLERVSVTGRVVEVSYSDAVAAIASEQEGLIALRARPQEIALLQPGDLVSLDVVEVGGSIWIAPAARFEPASADVTALPGAGGLSQDLSSPIFDERGRAEGIVTAVNESEGLFLVGDRQFQAHPLQLRGLAPGQLVSVSYGSLGDEDWAADIRVGAAP